MNETTHNLVPKPSDTVHAELRSLVASNPWRLTAAANVELTRLYWAVGQRLRTEVLGRRKNLAEDLSRATLARW